MKVKYTLLTAILLVFVLLVTMVPVASAKQDAGNNQAKLVDGVAIEKMIEKLEPFVTRCDDGTFRLDIPADAKINRTSKEFKAISQGMNSINQLIREGKLITTPDLTVYSVNESQFVLQDGINKYKSRWYGFEIWMNHDVCETVASAASITALAAALTSLVGVPAPIALVVATLLGVGAEGIRILDNGCGIHLKFIAGTPPILFYARGQSCS